jgi:hypothetical protein
MHKGQVFFFTFFFKFGLHITRRLVIAPCSVSKTFIPSTHLLVVERQQFKHAQSSDTYEYLKYDMTARTMT